MSYFNDVAKRATIEDFCKARNRVLELMEQGHRLYKAAEEESQKHMRYGLPHDFRPKWDPERVRREIDQRYWRECFKFTGLAKLMDDQATKEFDASLEKECPEFTVENIQTMALTMFQQKDELFNRGVFNVFRQLDHSYWSNRVQAFAVKNRSVATFIFDSWTCKWNGTLRINYSKRAWLNDLDRCLCVLGGHDYSEYSLETKIHAHFAEHPDDNTFENEYLKIRGFKNGNAHIWVTDPELLAKVNSTIAEYAGAAIPHDMEAA